jgi:hypothetical protein
MPPWLQQAAYLIGRPVGISLADGRGVSGILCNIDYTQRLVYVLEYLYASQYATKHYQFDEIQGVTSFPGCSPQPTPPPGGRLQTPLNI